MKNKSNHAEDDDPLDREIDFSKARPNPYWLGVVDRDCVRLIDKELAAIFPDNDAVNAALRTLADAARRALPEQKLSAKTAAVRPSARKKSRG